VHRALRRRLRLRSLAAIERDGARRSCDQDDDERDPDRRATTSAAAAADGREARLHRHASKHA
jgi:hypothetical protein